MAKRRKTRVAVDPEVSDSKKRAGQAWQRVIVLPIAAKEGWNELTPGQYLHVKDHVKQLVGFGRKEFDTSITIAPFGEFWELKIKGGVLGKKNIRVYFKHHQSANEIVVLHTYKKEDDGQAPRHIPIKLKNRFKFYLDRDPSNRFIVYEREETSERNN